MAKQTKIPNDELDKFLIRMPPGLRERIKSAADQNNRSMNAEIIDTLEKAYPNPTINIDELAHFLASLPFFGTTDDEEQYLQQINDYLAKTPYPYTLRPRWDGVISFYPYGSPQNDIPPKDPEDSEAQKSSSGSGLKRKPKSQS